MGTMMTMENGKEMNGKCVKGWNSWKYGWSWAWTDDGDAENTPPTSEITEGSDDVANGIRLAFPPPSPPRTPISLTDNPKTARKVHVNVDLGIELYADVSGHSSCYILHHAS